MKLIVTADDYGITDAMIDDICKAVILFCGGYVINQPQLG